ncbi:MAG: cobalamin-binding protein [Pirellulales bacterium]|nr:cobalamin-binding protein [Pirellulales bacterium]
MGTPSRIASLLPSATEMLFALGLGDRVVAVSHECDYPEEATSLPRITVSRIDSNASSSTIDQAVQQALAEGQPLYEIDLALLESVDCDLLITQSQCDVCAISQDQVLASIKTLGLSDHISVMTLHPETLEDVFRDLMHIGRACGAAERSESLVEEYRQRVARVGHRLGHLKNRDRPRVAMVEWIDPLMLAGNWIPEIFHLAGGRGPADESAGKSITTSWQGVVTFAPEVLVLCPCGFDVNRTRIEAEPITAWPHFSSLPAVRDGRCYAIDGNAYFNRSGPRLVESLEILAHLLHPRKIASPDAANRRQGAWKQLFHEKSSPARQKI